MSTRTFIPRTRLAVELEQALNEWLTASRRAYIAPSRDQREELEEDAAWRRVQFALSQSETLAAA